MQRMKSDVTADAKEADACDAMDETVDEKFIGHLKLKSESTATKRKYSDMETYRVMSDDSSNSSMNSNFNSSSLSSPAKMARKNGAVKFGDKEYKDAKKIVNNNTIAYNFTNKVPSKCVKSTYAKSTFSTTHQNDHLYTKDVVFCPSASNDSKSPGLVNLNARAIVEGCDGSGLDGLITLALSDQVPQAPRPPREHLSDDKLAPGCPTVIISSRKIASSGQLQDFCYHFPIVAIRGLTSVLKMDLGKFSTRTLIESHANHKVDVRMHVQQSGNDNVDASGETTWSLSTHHEHSTIGKYARYQASTFVKAVQDENDTGPMTNVPSDSEESIPKGVKKKRTKKRKINGGMTTNTPEVLANPSRILENTMIKTGTGVDLADERQWRTQLDELRKLPPFMRVVSAANMLSHVGYPISGVNTVNLHMKVPGSRTPGHQEPNNFCAVNINVGPGDCEWFATPDNYWGVISDMCEENTVNYLQGEWWPSVEELRARQVPVYRFMQKPGDIVWVNSACPHWSQALGWCNSVSWNVGPLTARQYTHAIERYEFNRLMMFRSGVPMLRLSWNLARHVIIPEKKLYYLIKDILTRSLQQTAMILNYVRAKKVPMRVHARDKREPSHFCGACDAEVFNILMVREVTDAITNRSQHVVFCYVCARQRSPDVTGYLCLQEYKMEDLIHTYDNFKYCERPINAYNAPRAFSVVKNASNVSESSGLTTSSVTPTMTTAPTLVTSLLPSLSSIITANAVKNPTPNQITQTGKSLMQSLINQPLKSLVSQSMTKSITSNPCSINQSLNQLNANRKTDEKDTNPTSGLTKVIEQVNGTSCSSNSSSNSPGSSNSSSNCTSNGTSNSASNATSNSSSGQRNGMTSPTIGDPPDKCSSRLDSNDLIMKCATAAGSRLVK